MKRLCTLCFCMLCFQWIRSQDLSAEMEGAMKIGNIEVKSPESGTIRWSGYDFEGFNGVEWVSLSGGLTGPVTDVDGNSYRTLKIGDQIWMTENLRTTKFRGGTTIPHITSASSWMSLSTPAYCWYDNDDALYEVPYGKLYNGFAVEGDSLCPIGWTIPTNADWDQLADFLLGTGVAGGAMKEAGTENWLTPNTFATNSSGFTALPGGLRISSTGGFFAQSIVGIYWSGDPFSGGFGQHWYMTYTSGTLASDPLDQVSGGSVRCLKID